MLVILTLVAAGLVVVALAGYLTAIALALRDARRSVSAIADGLEAVATNTRPVPETLETVNGALVQLHEGLRGAHEQLRRTLRVFRI
ncbi:MAG: hypothetical protein R3304_10435 [Longimicrobiales bacterium]|nr:hypothetical protein [Longimicrobiales bacterium]